VANGNGNVVKALGVAGLVIGVIGGAFGLSASVGPQQRLTDHERRIAHTEAICEDYQKWQARQDEAMKAVNEKLDRLLKAAGL